MSVLTTNGYNCDYDGDEMNFHLSLTNELYTAHCNLAPYYGIHDIMNLGQLNNCLRLPDVTKSVIGNYINSTLTRLTA